MLFTIVYFGILKANKKKINITSKRRIKLIKYMQKYNNSRQLIHIFKLFKSIYDWLIFRPIISLLIRYCVQI